MSTADAGSELRSTIRQALDAYETARAAKLRARQDATGEEARLHALVPHIEEVERDARQLLDRSAHAFVIGAPVSVEDLPAKKRSTAETVAAAFAESQLAYVSLRESLYNLGVALLGQRQYPDAIGIFEAMIDGDLPFSRDAAERLQFSYQAQCLEQIGAGQDREAIRRLATRALNPLTQPYAEEALVRILAQSLSANPPKKYVAFLAASVLAQLRQLPTDFRRKLITIGGIKAVADIYEPALIAQNQLQLGFPKTRSSNLTVIKTLPARNGELVGFAVEAADVDSDQVYELSVGAGVLDIATGHVIRYEILTHDTEYRTPPYIPGTDPESIDELSFRDDSGVLGISFRKKPTHFIELWSGPVSRIDEGKGAEIGFSQLVEYEFDRRFLQECAALLKGQRTLYAGAVSPDRLYGLVIGGDGKVATFTRRV